MFKMFDLPKARLNCPRKLIPFFISVRVFFHGHWRLTGRQRKGRDHILFQSNTSTCSETFRHLFATLHVRWLSHIFNRTTYFYQVATRWALPSYRITISLIDDVILFFAFLLDDLILGFCYIEYHPCIISRLTKCASQVFANIFANTCFCE